MNLPTLFLEKWWLIISFKSVLSIRIIFFDINFKQPLRYKNPELIRKRVLYEYLNFPIKLNNPISTLEQILI